MIQFPVKMLIALPLLGEPVGVTQKTTNKRQGVLSPERCGRTVASIVFRAALCFAFRFLPRLGRCFEKLTPLLLAFLAHCCCGCCCHCCCPSC